METFLGILGLLLVVGVIWYFTKYKGSDRGTTSAGVEVPPVNPNAPGPKHPEVTLYPGDVAHPPQKTLQG
jgi:hypothetical protein